MGIRLMVSSAAHNVNVSVVAWDGDEARAAIPEFDCRAPRTKALLAQASDAIDTDVQTVSNTTCIGLSEFIVDGLNASSPTPSADAVVEVGEGTSATSYSDTSLESKVTEVEVRTYADEGEQIRYRAFLPGNAANGTTISEVGIRAAGKLLNHALLASPISKDESTEATLSVVLSFTNA